MASAWDAMRARERLFLLRRRNYGECPHPKTPDECDALKEELLARWERHKAIKRCEERLVERLKRTRLGAQQP